MNWRMFIRVVSFLVTIVSLSVFVLTFVGCTTHVEPGHVGVRIVSCGSDVGVDPVALGVGYHSTGVCTTIVEYPTFMQAAVWTHNLHEGHPVDESITFTNADQMSIAADISLAYTLDPKLVPAFYSRFKADNLDVFTHGFLRNIAREKFDEAAGKYKIESIMGNNSDFLKEVRTNLQNEVFAYGINISQFGFIGAPRPPESIIKAINLKLEATQRSIQVENELRESQAQAKKSVAKAEGEALAEIAKAKGDAESKKLAADAEAYANQKIASSLSSVLVEYRKVSKWDGKLPTVSGGSTLVNLK